MRRPSPSVLVLAALVAVSTVARAVAGVRIQGPWIVPDEMIYASLGRSLWEDGDLRIFGGPSGIYGLVYPALAGLPLVLAGPETGYAALKVVQAAVMSLTAVPVFFWTRRLAGPGWALVAAALTVAAPALVYSGLIMTEVAFYPAVTLAAWAIAAALERPTPLRQGLLVAAVAFAAATRLQALVLPLVLLTAMALHALLDRSARRTLRLWPAVAALASLGAAWTAWRAVAAGSAAGALGSYSSAADAPYAASEVARFVVYHFGNLILLTALVPACAVALLLVEAARGRVRDGAVRAYVAVAVALVLWTVVEVGAFASVYVNRLAERDLVVLAPTLFVGFGVWLGRGAPRGRLVTSVTALAALAVVLTVPLRDFVVQEAVPDAFGLVPLLWLRERTSPEMLELAVWAGAAGGLALLALLPRRALAVLPVAALAGLAFASAAATREVSQNAAFDRRNLVGGTRGWIDRAVDAPVAYVFVGEPANFVWHQLFWNERLRRVYVLAGFEPDAAFPLQTTVRADSGGRLRAEGRPISERVAVAADALRFVGEPAARVALEAYEQSGLTVWRLGPPPRVSSFRTGVRPDGDMHEPGRLRVWDCSRGRLELTLLPKASTRIELRVNGETVEVLDDVAGKEFVLATVSPPPGADICIFEVVPDSLLGSTRFEFVR